ncbi:MAG: YjjI family glycine radical enzyme [Desulfosporosinus sp.]|nr:YjjI family glycine radical enzyme [Desulfosporosinus sp.]
MNGAMEIIKNVSIDWKQKKAQLAALAQNSLPYVRISPEARSYMESGVLDDLNEGHAPCSPRYLLPDYAKFIKQGSRFLDLKPPADLYEAITALQILYNFVPSVTGLPVFLGRIDELLEPFSESVTERECRNLLRNFLIYIDRTLPDGFVHMNIGPQETMIGRLVLELEKELKKAVPNLSLIINEETPDSFLALAAETALVTGKPYFANDRQIREALGDNYGIASCYNSLKLGGGSFTLVRLNLKQAAEKISGVDDFIKHILPDIIKAQCEIINARARFLVEEVRFFENSFLVREGLLDIGNFTSMAGIFGLFECVEQLTGGLKVGRDEAANQAAVKIIEAGAECLNATEGAYCYGTGGRIGFHAQSLIDSDVEVTAGVRIRVGEEPSIFDQIRIESRLQRPFNTGVSDIYVFDSTAQTNVAGLLTIIKGALKNGIKMLALSGSDSELVRITGYLVKKSDLEAYHNHEQMREDTVQLGANSFITQKPLARKVRSVD